MIDMNFGDFVRRQQRHINELLAEPNLFVVNVDKHALYDLYLDTFPTIYNPMFRVRRYYDCSSCRNFIKNIGNVVRINEDCTLTSMWNFDAGNEIFQGVIDTLNGVVAKGTIVNQFAAKQKTYGNEFSLELTGDEEIIWNHLHAHIPKMHVRNDIGKWSNDKTTTKNVLEKGLTSISRTSLEIGLDLISQKAFPRGETLEENFKYFIKLIEYYDTLSSDVERNNFIWLKATTIPAAISRLANTSAGVFLLDISENTPLENALAKYEKITAPENYQRPILRPSKQQVNEAEQIASEQNLLPSLSRKFAVIDDLTINELLYADRNTKAKLDIVSVFDEIRKEIPTTPQKFDGLQTISIDDFIRDVLPRVKSMELYVENKHMPNFVSLIGPTSREAKPLFYWENNFSLAFAGNLADVGSMRSRVVEKGGRVDGVLRFTHTWNYDLRKQNQSLMDLHIFFPGYRDNNKSEVHDRYPACRRVGWNCRKDNLSGGVQDVDYTHEPGSMTPIENITFPSIKSMPDGEYTLKIHNWRARNPNLSGFKAEVEFNNQIYKFHHEQPLSHKQWVTVAVVTLDNGVFSIDPKLPMSSSEDPIDIWNVKTNTFVPVTAMMYSPNYWGYNKGIKQYVFMLQNCVNPDQPSGFFNENLISELKPHRKVFEVLGEKMKVANSDQQLSGLGFSASKRSEVVVKLEGYTSRMIKILF